MGLGSYPKIYAVGHRALKDLLLDDVLVEEKIDGSQFSFGIVESSEPLSNALEVQSGRWLLARSKGAPINMFAPEGLFKLAVESIMAKAHLMIPGWVYRGEYLSRPKHNVLAYDRVPEGNIMIFDVNTRLQEEYLPWDTKAVEASRLGYEFVPKLYEGRISEPDQIRGFLERKSVLGSQLVEGVVIKNYKRFGIDGKALMGKFVSETFKEVHAGEWRDKSQSGKDFTEKLAENYRTPARWQKAVQRMREAGRLDGSPRDIGELIKLVHQDIQEECYSEIAERLARHAMPHVIRKSTSGLAEWYKGELLKSQFEAEPDQRREVAP